jgi:hypothetical protein
MGAKTSRSKKQIHQQQHDPDQAIEPAVKKIEVERHVGVFAALAAEFLVVVGVAVGAEVDLLVVFAKRGPGQNVVFFQPRLLATFFARPELHG